MTTVITRVFADVSNAEQAVKRLDFRGLPRANRQIIVAGEKAEVALINAKVHETAVLPYKKHLTNGRAVLVVHATYKPLGVARMTREILEKFNTIETGAVIDDFRVAWEPEKSPSVLKDHPLFFSIEGLEPPSRVSDSFGVTLIKKRKGDKPLLDADTRISSKFWPMKLLSTKQRSSSVISGGRHMSKLFWPMKLTSDSPRRKSVISNGGFPFSRRFGLRLLS